MISEQRIVNAVIAQSDVMVAAMIKAATPKKDSISQRKAYEMFGRTWVEEMTAAGRAITVRTAGKVLYSRHQLEALRAVQQTIAREQINILTRK